MKLSIDSYEGVIVPMVTPLDANHKIDKASSSKLINFLLDHNTIPFVLGTTGEAPSIPVREREELVKVLVGHKRNGIPAIAGVIGLSFVESVEEANKYISFGVDAIVVTLPKSYELTDQQVYNYYYQLARQIDGDIILYNIPKTVHQSLSLDIVDQLSHIDNILGIKDSELNEERLEYALRLWKDRKDFKHFMGTNALMPRAIELGTDGIVPSTANIDPDLYTDLMKKGREGNQTRVQALFDKTKEWSAIYQKGKTLGNSLAALKYILSVKDLCKPHVMLPISELSEEEKAGIMNHLSRV